MPMKIKLTHPHTHAGRKYPAGAEIDLPDRKAQWLIGLERAEKAGKAAAKTTTKTTEE